MMNDPTTTLATVRIGVKYSGSEQVRKLMRINVKNALRAMAEATLQRSRLLAPELTGSLKADGRVEENAEENSVAVVYGSPVVRYARRRHFENNLHPETKYYLQDAGDTVAKEGLGKYL